MLGVCTKILLVLQLAMAASAGRTCPYKVCYCPQDDPSSIDCSFENLDEMPTLQAGTPYTVTHLHLSNNNIRTIPDGQLPPSLTHLNLQRNALTSLPPAVSSLSYLSSLFVSHNQLTSLDHTAPLPNTLTKLGLSSNLFTKIPDLSYLTNLQKLLLSNNNISNTIGGDCDLPPSLTRLTLYHNSLTTIPAGVTNLANLTYLYVNQNNIASIDGIVFPKSLLLLEVSYNSITAIATPLTFKNTNDDDAAVDNNLETLKLSDNPLTSIAADAFKNLKQLSRLYLTNTGLTRLPVALSDLTNINFLFLPDVECTCQESSPLMASWYSSRPSLFDHFLYGDCVAANISVLDFLKYHAEHCPP